MARDLKAALWVAGGWLAAAFFVFTTIQTTFSGGGLWALIAGLPLIFLASPFGRGWIKAKTAINLTGWPLYIMCFVLLGVQVNIASKNQEAARQAEEARIAGEQASKAAKDRAVLLNDFNLNKMAILSDLDAKIEAGHMAEAKAVIAKYTTVTQDPDLARRRTPIELAEAKSRLPGIEKRPIEQQLSLYKTLASLEPFNKEFSSKAKSLADQVAQAEADKKAQEEKDARAAQREKAITAQFSGWDGSHYNLERLVKASLKNPDSYKHVETRYYEEGDRLIVTTTIRATNSFGAVVPNTFVAEVDLQGNVLSVRER